MKILIYSGRSSLVRKSGIGVAMNHQKKILKQAAIPCTDNPKEAYDIIHLNTIFPDSLFMSRRAKRKGKKVIYYAHSTLEDFQNSFRGSNVIAPLFKKWITYCYNSGDVIITPTDYSKNLLSGYGLNPPIYSVSNGIDVSYYLPDEKNRHRFREKYHIPMDQKVITSVGHYMERKGITDFVHLAKKMPDYQFYWFGHTNANLLTRGVKEAVQTKLPNLHFPGYVSRSEIRDAYHGSDLFLFLTHEETEGIVLLEALASKTPVLIRDIPIYSGWLKDRETVYKASSLKHFQERITQILEGEVPNLTQTGYQVALNRDLKKVGQQLIEIYGR